MIALTGSDFLLQVIAGLGAGAVLFLLASGLTLIFGALEIINLAHGSLYMLGAYVSFSVAGAIGVTNATFWVLLLGGALVIGLGGAFMEVIALRPVYERHLLTQLLVTFAFFLMIGGIVRQVWGASGESPRVPPFLQGGVPMLGGQVPKPQFFFLGLATVVAGLLWFMMQRTNVGRLVRAALYDPVLLRQSGINVPALFTAIFAAGCALAGLAGAAVSVQGAIGPGMATDGIIKAFVVVVIGGLGSLGGAFVAAFVVGVAEAIGVQFVPQASLAIVFAILVLVLVFRPQGLFGARAA